MKGIQDLLNRAFLGDAWHGPALMEVLAGIDAASAAARPVPEAHSIWEIVHHIAAWEEAVHRRLQGHVVELSPDEDWPLVPEPTESAWTASLENLANTHAALLSTIASLSDDVLPKLVPGKDYSVYFMLHGVIQHDLYHTGQIAILKKAI